MGKNESQIKLAQTLRFTWKP